MGMKIEGFRELEAKLAALAAIETRSKTRKVVQQGVLEAVQPMVKSAKTKAPRGNTGRLQDGIKASNRAPRGAKAGRAGAKQVRAFVSSTDQKTAWIEYGTKERHHASGKSVGHIERQPFMRPAYDETKEEILKSLGTVVSEAIQTAINEKGSGK